MRNLSRSKKSDKRTGKKSKQKTSRGKPVRIPGNDKGKVTIKPDFDTPLPEFNL